LILFIVVKSLKIIAKSKFLMPKMTLSKTTASISFTSITKNGNSLIATKQSFVGLIFTTCFYGQPKNDKSSIGISTISFWRFCSAAYSISLLKAKNLLFNRLRCYLSCSSCSSSSMSLSLCRFPLKLISSAAIPDSL
jgi:hypothetical protein